MKSLQNKYNLIKEGKGNKELFIKEARTLFPNIVTNVLTFDQAIHNLNERGIISEGFTGELSQRKGEPNWFKIFSENTEAVKATLKDTDKAVVEKETAGYNYEDKKNNNNISTNELLSGYYVEIKDPKNADKTEDELKKIVFKNLEKDPLYYIKDGAFGVKGIGYTQDAPGLGPTKEVTGKYKSSGMEPVKLNESKHGDEAELGLYKSELKMLNKIKTTAERHTKRKAELEKKIADLEKSTNKSLDEAEEEKYVIYSYPYGEPEKKELYQDNVTLRYAKQLVFRYNNDDDSERFDYMKKADWEASKGSMKENANEISEQDWQFVYDWVKTNAVKWVNKNGINSPLALKQMFTADTPSNMISIIDRETNGKFGQLPKVKRMFTMPEGEHTVKNNMENRTTLSEAKKRKVEKELAEIDKLSEVAALEYKIGKIQEKIEELKNRLTMTESDDMKDVVDKKASSEIKKDIALLEKRSKMYGAKKNNLAKKLKPSAASGNGVREGAVGGEEMIDESKAPMWEEAMKSVLKRRGY